jgi:hypothetical protein
MVEGESRPEGAEHRASSYIVDGTSQGRDDSAQMPLILTQVAEGNANRERTTQLCVTHKESSRAVDPLEDALIQ